jgi:hypothetical protein
MAAKFHERFEIEIKLEEARRRFVNRAHQLMFDEFWRPLPSSKKVQIVKAVGFALGDDHTRLGVTDIARSVGSDFLRNLHAIEVLYKDFFGQNSSEHEEFVALLGRVMDASEIDLGIQWENGQFIWSGAALLDEHLVNDPLRWLRSPGYETVLLPFEKALGHFLHASTRPELLSDVVTDMYEALEALARIVTGRDRDLAGNQQLFLNGSALHVMLVKQFHATVDQKRFPHHRRSTESDGHQRCVSTVSVSQAQEKWPYPQRQTESSMSRLWSPICRML